MARIILAGGSGFLGQLLAQHFSSKGDEVLVLTRHPTQTLKGIQQVQWDAQNLGSWAQHLDGADVLINLTGKSVNCRYTNQNKREIIDSRVNSTLVLGQALRQCAHPPKLWVNAASATIYRHALDGPQDEFTGELGTGFSVEVCQQWEDTFFSQATPGIRQVALRIAIVLEKDGGVIPYFRNLARFGLGGPQGNGLQCFSWLHARDFTGMVDFVVQHPELEGVFNLSSPRPVPNHHFMRAMRQALKVPFGLPAYKWMLQVGALVLGTETELLLKSRWVLPTRLQQAGYSMQVTTIEDAVRLCVG